MPSRIRIIPARLVALPALWLVLAAAPGCDDPAWSDLLLGTAAWDEAIVGGTETTEWPAIGAYMMDGGANGLCTGTLVRPDRVLTAAHCAVSAGPDDLFVIGHDVWGGDNEWHSVASAHIHPDYTGDSYNFHDIAVLELDEPIEHIEYIPVNTTGFDHTWEDRWFHMVGFGSDTHYGGPGSGLKRETDLQMVDYYLEIFFTYTSYTNTCSGDSGGPALVDLDGHWFVAGVNSAVYSGVNPDDSCSGGAIEVRVDHELEFLEEFFDPYEIPYPDPDPEDDDADGDDDAGADDDEGDGCECTVGEGSGPVAALPLLLLGCVLGLRRAR